MLFDSLEPVVDPLLLAKANGACDAQLASYHLSTHDRLRSNWRSEPLRSTLLTDKQIAHYEELGYYSAEYRAARREFMARYLVRAQRKREGNFRKEGERLIFSPL